MSKRDVTVDLSGKIDGVICGYLILCDGNFYDVSGETMEDFVADATALANHLGVKIEVWNTEVVPGCEQ